MGLILNCAAFYFYCFISLLSLCHFIVQVVDRKRKLVSAAVLEKPLAHCDSSQLGADSKQCPRPYGVDAFVDAAIVVVKKYISQDVRTPPLMISSLARGGKTTALNALFVALKELNGVRPVIVSFNGNSGFVKGLGETCCEAFLRVVAAQFVSNPKGIFSCTEEALETHFGEATIVLLIDELNALCAMLDEDLSLLLKKIFLDRPNRYLVFTSHYPMEVDVGFPFTGGASGRVCEKVQLPRCTDVDKLRGMADECQALQPCRVAMYSGASINSLSIQERFDNKTFSMTGFDDTTVQDKFVCELLEGTAMIRDFDIFSCVDPGGKFMFPVAYIKCIIGRMDNSIAYGVREVVQQLETYSGQYETGKDWECIVLLALLLRCFRATKNTYNLFDRVPLNPQVVKFVLLPSNCTTLEGARRELAVQAGISSSCVVIAYPTATKFPFYDSMLLVRSGDQNKYIGLQMKLGNEYPAGGSQSPNTDEWNGGSFWVRGRATETSGITNNGWVYLTKEELTRFLGYSLGTLYPATWHTV